MAYKILERIVKANILQYLKTDSILSDAQHSFVPRRSCLTKLIVSEELITGIIGQCKPLGCRLFRYLESLCFGVSSSATQEVDRNRDPPQDNPLGGGIPKEENFSSKIGWPPLEQRHRKKRHF